MQQSHISKLNEARLVASHLKPVLQPHLDYLLHFLLEVSLSPRPYSNFMMHELLLSTFLTSLLRHEKSLSYSLRHFGWARHHRWRMYRSINISASTVGFLLHAFRSFTPHPERFSKL